MSDMKISSKKQLIVVGDRVLIRPDEGKQKTNHGLYLPQGVESKEKIQSGYVIKTGPGYPMPDPNTLSDEPWTERQQSARYLPLEVEEGDYVLFIRKTAIEIEFEREKFLIVPQSAILLIIREDILNDLTSEEE